MTDVGRRETDGRRSEEPRMDGKHWTPARGGLSGCPRGPRSSAEGVAVEVMSQPRCREERYWSEDLLWCGKTGTFCVKMDSGGSAVWMEEGKCCFANPECCAGTESCCVVRLTRQLTGVNSGRLVGFPGTVYGKMLAVRLESVYSQP